MKDLLVINHYYSNEMKYISILITILGVLTLISVAHAQCSGTFDCYGITDDDVVCRNAGCTWTPDKIGCSGTPSMTDCSIADDQKTCESVACKWNSTDNTCSGIVAGCNVAITSYICQEIGCTWEEVVANCDGAGDCSLVPDEGTCVSVVGCVWEEEAPEGQFDCKQLEITEEIDDCWFGIAMNSRNIELCGGIEDDVKRGECKDALIEHGERKGKRIQGVEMEGGEVIGADSDNDGVLDDSDQCPNTPVNTPVDETGCKVEPPQTVEACVEFVTTQEVMDDSGRVIGADDCYMYFAFEEKDSSYCDSILDVGMKENCEQSVGGGFRRGFEQGKEEFEEACPVVGMPETVEECKLLNTICKRAGGVTPAMSDVEVDHCIHHIAWINDNINLCDQVSERNIKNDCLRSLGGDFEGKERERQRHKGPEGGMPVEIPIEILEAGAGQDFIDMFCNSISTGINQQLKGSMQVIIDHFTALNNDPDLSEYLNIDVSPIEGIVVTVASLVDNICASTPDTFKAAVMPLKELLEGGEDAIGAIVDSVFKQMDDQIRAAMRTLQSQISAEMEALMLQVQAEMETRMQAAQSEVMAEAQAKVASGEITQQQMQSYIEDQIEIRRLELEAELFTDMEPPSAIKMQALGSKLESMMRDMEVKMREMEQAEVTAIVAEIKQRFMAMKTLFRKIGDYKLLQAEAKRDELIAEGTDTTVFDNALDELRAQMIVVEALFDQAAANMDNVNMEDDDTSNDIWELEAAGQELIDAGIEEMMDLWDAKQVEVEEQLSVQMQKKLVEKFLDKLDDFKAVYDTRLAEAQADGLTTTRLEELYADILENEIKAIEAYDAENYDEALMYLGLIKAKYELMEKEWRNIKKEGIINGFLGKTTALQNRLASALKRAEMFEARGVIDATNLKALINEFNALITSAESKRNAGNFEDALTDLEAAKLKMDAITIEWTSLAKGVGGT